MNAQTLIATLGGQWHGTYGMARCPAHNDTNPSLSIRDGEDGKLLVHCFAGCDERVVLAKLGHDRGEGPTSPSNNRTTVQHIGCTLTGYAAAKHLSIEFLRGLGITDIAWNGHPAIRMPYRDFDGGEVAVRFRIAVDGEDKFRWRNNDKAHLYGLDRLAAGSKAGIALVEGESDCHTLWQAGFAAVGVPGAANWREERDAAALDGFDIIYVVVEPDQGGQAVLKWLAKSKVRNRARLVRLGEFKDASALYSNDPAAFAERWNAYLAAAVPWADEAARQISEAREAAWRQCKGLAMVPDITAKFSDALSSMGVVGEDRIAKLLYLGITSRVLDHPVSIAVKGPSSGGKSFITERVLQFFPADAYFALSSMSERALAYSAEPLAHRMLVLFEAAGLRGEFASYLMRSLLSEGRVRYETVEKSEDGSMHARVIEREGPTGLIVTTTSPRLHPENETRLLSLTVTDTPEHTAAIFHAQAARYSGQPAAQAADQPDLQIWHALQSWIATGPKEVAIPFANAMAELTPPVAVRMRRDFTNVLSLIAAHALLHQATRDHTAEGRVVADVADYAAVRDLVSRYIGEGIEAAVPETVRETVEAVRKTGGGVSVTQLSMVMKLDKASVSRRVKDAIGRGYLRNDETKKGQAAKLVVADPMPEELLILPTVAAVERCCGVVALQEGGELPPSPLTDDVPAGGSVVL